MVDYKQHRLYTGEPILPAYAIITIDDFNKIILSRDSVLVNPDIIYYLTKSGGVYATDENLNTETYSCCKYGDVSKIYLQIKAGILTKEDTIEINKLLDSSLQKTLSKKQAFEWSIKNKDEDYRIVCWKVKSEFCT
ncbi:MAG: hypothetical protein ACHQHP_04230, partial [Bacteroidia bacterium]